MSNATLNLFILPYEFYTRRGLVCANRRVRTTVPQGRMNLDQDDNPGNMSSNSARPTGTAETAENEFSRPMRELRHTSSLPQPRTASWAKFSRPLSSEAQGRTLRGPLTPQ